MRADARPPLAAGARAVAALVLALATLPAASSPGRAQSAIPVLCYHGFSETDEPAGGPLTESFARFEAMLRFLDDHGFETVFPDDVAEGASPDRAVIITFDDGRREQLRAAMMMERYGFRGLFFVIPARLDEEDPGFLTRNDLARLARAGHRIAPHGYAHRSMVGSGREMAASLVRSPAVVRAHAGPDHIIADFAFPFGHYGDEIVEALAAEYRFLHTVNPGYWDGASPLVSRMLMARSTPLELYTEYLMAAADHRPVARLLSPDGGAGGTAVFEIDGAIVPADIRMLVISPDRHGRMYAAHPLAENVRVAGDNLEVDVRAHLERHYTPDRAVVSYALIARDAHGVRYLTPGYLQWLD